MTKGCVSFVSSTGCFIKLDPEVENIVRSQNRKETECSACGRYIGSWEICPFCRHYNPKRWQVRLIKYSSPFLTILGIVLLMFLGKVYGTSDVRIAELGRKANFAQVRIDGRVSGDVRVYASDSDSGMSARGLEFEVDDGTGIIRIRCYEDAFDELRKARNLPGAGDHVTLIGNYQYKAKRQFVILSSSSDLKIERARPERATPLSHVSRAEEHGLPVGERLKVTGRVKSVEDGLYERTFWLTGPDGSATPVVLSRSALDAYGPSDPGAVFCRSLKPGDYVSCFGTLNMSRGRVGRHWQVSPATPADLLAADEMIWKADNAGN